MQSCSMTDSLIRDYYACFNERRIAEFLETAVMADAEGHLVNAKVGLFGEKSA